MNQAILIVFCLGCVYGGGFGPGQYLLVKVPAKHSGGAHVGPVPHGASGPGAVEGPPSPYNFNYHADANGGGSSRSESGDSTGKVTGTYSVTDADGRTRQVSYVADKEGFKANVHTNEAGTANESPADVQVHSSAAAGHGAGAAGHGAGVAGHGAGPAATSYHHAVSSHGHHQQQSYVPTGVEGPPAPYSFEYNAQLEDGSSSRKEAGDSSGRVSGSYSLSVNDGRNRQVDYVADSTGFKANVKTNEPGTKSESPAEVSFLSSAPLPAPAYHAGPTGHGSGTSHFQSHSTSSSSSYSTSGVQAYFSPPLAAGPGGAPAPYSFGYDAKLDKGTLSQKESGDSTGKVSGSYSFTVDDGRNRHVDYTADAGGFRATVKTNEQGTKSDSPADVLLYSSAPGFHAGGAAVGGGAVHGGVATHRDGAAHHYQSTSSGSQYFSPPVGGGPGDAPSPYSFNYDANIDLGRLAQRESGDANGKVTGSYSFSVDDGRNRQVDYVADADGFRATVKTNEQGTKSESPADVTLYSSAPAPSFPTGGAAPYGGSAFKGGATHSGSTSHHYQASSSSAGSVPQIHFSPPLGSGPGDAPSPYNFNYNADVDMGRISQSETGDASGRVAGSYSFSVDDGRNRQVDYVADAGGFKASVKTNEPGTKSDSPADVSLYSSAPAPAFPAGGAGPYHGGAPSGGLHHTQVSHTTSHHSTQQQHAGSDAGPPSPYSFSYQAESDTGSSSRKEAGDGSGRVTGSYSVKDNEGNTRVVDYTADKDGFKANVQTNEPGTKSEHPADVVVHSSAPAPVHPVHPAPAPQTPLFPPVSSYSGPKGTSGKKYLLVPYQGQGQW